MILVVQHTNRQSSIIFIYNTDHNISKLKYLNVISIYTKVFYGCEIIYGNTYTYMYLFALILLT